MMFPKKKWMSVTVLPNIVGKSALKAWPEKDKNSLKKNLDKIFSEYIRRRDIGLYAVGYCTCVTCGRFFRWEKGDCGHFVQRDRIAVRWNEKNAAAQCTYCNRFRSGEQHEFGRQIDIRWGAGTAEQLKALGRMRGNKIDAFWLELEIKRYKELIKNLKRR